jgi:hypothetical protein
VLTVEKRSTAGLSRLVPFLMWNATKSSRNMDKTDKGRKAQMMGDCSSFT